MANPNLLTRADLILWLVAASAALNAHDAPPIVNADQEALADALDTVKTALSDAEDAVVAAKAASEAAIATAQTSASTLLSGIQSAKYEFKAQSASLDSYAAVGLTPPATGRSAIVALPPEIVAVLGKSNGTNELRFRNANRSGSVSIEVHRRVGGPESPWVIVGVTKKQTFMDEAVPMGELTEYKLKAVSSTTLSPFSNTAALYTDPVVVS